MVFNTDLVWPPAVAVSIGCIYSPPIQYIKPVRQGHAAVIPPDGVYWLRVKNQGTDFKICPLNLNLIFSRLPSSPQSYP